MRRRLLIVAAVLACVGALARTGSSASELPPNWHVHDGQTALGPEHKGIGVFPAMLGVSQADYLEDPAQCPDATDKAFLPQGRQDGQPLRAGICMTSTAIIHQLTVPLGTSGPEGWSSITTASEAGWITYYLVTPR